MYSFTNIKIIVPGLIIFTIRNIIPLYDFEDRRKTIVAVSQNKWNLIVLTNIVMSMINLLLLNNVMDKGFLVMGTALTVVLYYGIFQALFIQSELVGVYREYISAFIVSTMILILFMYLQKRIVKEVFMEMKQRIS